MLLYKFAKNDATLRAYYVDKDTAHMIKLVIFTAKCNKFVLFLKRIPFKELNFHIRQSLHLISLSIL